jgi:hypothetical protein
MYSHIIDVKCLQINTNFSMFTAENSDLHKYMKLNLFQYVYFTMVAVLYVNISMAGNIMPISHTYNGPSVVYGRMWILLNS